MSFARRTSSSPQHYPLPRRRISILRARRSQKLATRCDSGNEWVIIATRERAQIDILYDIYFAGIDRGCMYVNERI